MTLTSLLQSATRGRPVYLTLIVGPILLVAFGATGIALASEPSPQILEPSSYRIRVGASPYYEHPPGTPWQGWGYIANIRSSIPMGSIEPDPFIYSINGRQYRLWAMHANLHPDEIRLSIRLLFQVAIGDEAALEDVPDSITLTSGGRTITLRRVSRAISRLTTDPRYNEIPDFKQTIEANYGAPGATDTDTARAMFIDHRGETINVTLSPRGFGRSPSRPPDRVTGGFLHSGWPSVDWQYTQSPRLPVAESQVRFYRRSNNPEDMDPEAEPPWELGPVISLTDPGPSGRNTFPPSSFGPGNPPWGDFVVQVRAAYDYDGDIEWSDWSRDYRFRYLPPAPTLTPLAGQLRVEVEPRAGYRSHEARYETYRQGNYFHRHSSPDDDPFDLGSSTVGVIPDLRGGAGYEVQVRYSDGNERSEWSEPARATPLRPRQTMRFMAVFAEEEPPSGRSRGNGFGPDQRVWPGSDFTPKTYEYNRVEYGVAAFQWGNQQESYSPSTLGRNDLLITGAGHSSAQYTLDSIYPQLTPPLPDDDFEVVINGRSYGRTESLFLTRWNALGIVYASDYIRGIRDVADDLRSNVPLNTPVTVEFRYGEGR